MSTIKPTTTHASTKKFLVEIRVKTWIQGEIRVIAYDEVEAVDEYSARHAAVANFKVRLKTDQTLQDELKKRGITNNDWCVPDAIELN